MSYKRLLVGCVLGVASLLFLVAGGHAEEAKKAGETKKAGQAKKAGRAKKKGGKFVFVLPVYLAEGLQLTTHTPATKELLERADAQCIDDACKEQVSKCRQDIPQCLLAIPRKAVQENREEAE